MTATQAEPMMIFIPVQHQDAIRARTDGHLDAELIGFAATIGMIGAHGYREDEIEDADYAAQVYASIAGLAAGDQPRRLVLAADVTRTTVAELDEDADYGAVRLPGLDWKDVTAVFVDDASAEPAVQTARQAIADSTDRQLATLLDLPAVIALTDDHELLWHTPAENW